MPIINSSEEHTFNNLYRIRQKLPHKRELNSLISYKPCENDGNFVNGKCECIYPFVGARCVDYSCGK